MRLRKYLKEMKNSKRSFLEPAIKVIGLSKCTGCFGCKNSCPVSNAIEMKIDSEGFYKPYITKFCINCGKCQQGCPVISYEKNNKLNGVYAAWSLDNRTVLKSSSGGIFTEIAKIIIENEGVVFGATWDQGIVKHSKINKIEEVYKLQGSKYIPSDIGETFIEVKKYLKLGKKVLYSGLPCQIAALKKIVSNENLLTVDLICHGVPSLNVFKKYINELSKEEFKSTDFRNKDKKWTNFLIRYFFRKEIITHSQKEDIFFRGFMKDVYLGKPCYNCQFKGEKSGNARIADITLADFWGIPRKLFNKDQGVSLVVLNNEKARLYFELLEKNIFFEEVTIEKALKWNKSFFESAKSNQNRKEFFKDLSEYTMPKLEKKYFPRDKKIYEIYSFSINLIKRFIKFILWKIGVLE